MANDTDRPDGSIRVGTWNVQWATPHARRAPLLAEVLAAPDCDILCVTEGDAGVLPDGGHVIDAGTDWGYRLRNPGRRKVLPLESTSLDARVRHSAALNCLAADWLRA